MLSKFFLLYISYFPDAAVFDNRTEFAENKFSKLVEKGRLRHEVARTNHLQYNSMSWFQLG